MLNRIEGALGMKLPSNLYEKRRETALPALFNLSLPQILLAGKTLIVGGSRYQPKEDVGFRTTASAFGCEPRTNP
jgi:hypothetical protein